MPEATGVGKHTLSPSRETSPGNAGRRPDATGRRASGRDDLTQRVHAVADGLRPLVVTAEAAQEARAKAQGAPRWTDVFTTQFTEFSNRPR